MELVGGRDWPKRIEPLATVRRDFTRLTQHQSENLMTGRDLRQQFVGRKQDSLDFGDLIGWQGVVEILSHDVRVDPDVRTAHVRSRQSPPSHHLSDPADKDPRHRTLLDLLPDLFGLGRFQHIIQIGQ